jgi:hypothetical protein
MANNLGVTAGSGALLATDELTKDGQTAHVQLVKVVSAAEDSLNPFSPNADGSVNVQALGMAGAINTGKVDLVQGAIAVPVPTTPLANRKVLVLLNDSDFDMWVGPSGITESTGATPGMKMTSGQPFSINGVTAVFVRAGTGGAVGTKRVLYFEQA